MKASYLSTKFPISVNSFSVKTLPHGLDGLQTTMAFAPALNPFSIMLISKSYVGGTNGTYIGWAPDNIASAP